MWILWKNKQYDNPNDKERLFQVLLRDICGIHIFMCVCNDLSSKVTLLLCYQYDICFHSFIDSALVAYKYCGTLQNLVLPKVCCIYDTSIFLHLYCNPTLKGNFCIKSIHYYNIWPCTIRFDPHRFCNRHLI